MYPRNTIVRARVNKNQKHDAENILAHLGLTMSDAINALISQIKLNQGLPFPIQFPNRVTEKTLEDSRNGKNVKKFASMEELFDDLDN